MGVQAFSLPAYVHSYRTLVAARGADVRAWRRGASVASLDDCWESNVFRRHYVSPRPSSPAPGRVSSYRTPLSAALSLPSRAITPLQFECRSCIPTPWVIERPSRARASTGKSALRGNGTMRRWRGQPGAATGGSLCRCSLRPVRRPAQLADWPPRRVGGHRRADETPTPSVCRLLSDRPAPPDVFPGPPRTVRCARRAL